MRKKMRKRIMSSALAVSMLAMTWGGTAVNAASDYADYVVGEKPANLIPDASTDYGVKYLNTKHSKIDTEFYKTDAELDGGCRAKFSYNGTGVLELSTAWRGFEGFSLNNGNASFGFVPEDGATYVLSVNLKNMSENGVTPSIGAAMNNTYGPANLIYTNEYGESGMRLTDNWQKFNASITLPADYTSKTANGDYAKHIHIGFPAGTAEGAAFAVDVSTKDAVYFAKEAAYDITLSSEKENENKIDFTAGIINQIGTKGNLSQEFDWIVLDGNNNAVDSVTVTPLIGTSKVSVTWNDGEDVSNYKIAAVSKDYAGFTRLSDLGGEKPVKIYVAVDGDDSNNGNIEAPLATLAGAKAKIRELRKNAVGNPIEVEFAEGKYYFDQTVSFTETDSQTAKVTFKAENGKDVVFTGAVSLDLANASGVTDYAVLNKLKDEVKNKVVEMDLPSSITLGNSIGATIKQLQGEYEYPELYLDGNKQSVAQWPNGDGNYTTFKYVPAGSSVLSSVITYTDEEPKSWQKADNMWLGGYFAYDYLYQRMPIKSIGASGFELETADGVIVANGAQTEISKRYKAFNVLEELDIPGEWYIDWNNKKVYYYSPQTDSNSTLEISSLKGAMISLADADNIAFEGITFEGTRGDAIHAKNVENIKVNKCTFKNIGVDAVTVKGTAWAESDKNYWQRQYIDAAYNFEVADNVFFNVGGHAIVMDGGNVDTLKPSGNVIKNNIFNRCSQTIKNYESILIKGCGTSFINNNVSCSAFQAIRHYGNNHTISYNEIYNVNQETDDCGAIYCGRNTIQRGTVISYNYLHDLKSVEELPFGHQVGIYWDDNQTGMKAEYNIIKNVNKNFYTNGVDNYFCNNTSIDIAKTNLDVRNGGAASNSNTEQTAFAGNIADEELYFAAYPNLKTIIEKASRTDASLGALNRIENNLMLGNPGNGIGTNMTPVNNTETTDTTIFVNPEAQDYRVKNTSKYSSYLLNEDFDIDSIGVVSDNTLTMDKVELCYPANNDKLNSDSVHFEWNYVPGAVSYTITVARDADFKNVIANVDSYYNYADIEISLDASKYYWKVSAKNTSREFADVIESDVYSFVNGEKISVNASISNGMITAEITNNSYEDGKNVDVYIAQYDADGNLLKVEKAGVALDYLSGYVLTEDDADMTVLANAKTVGIFVWEGMIPLAEPTKL